MSADPSTAAAVLLTRIDAPRGAVNTLIGADEEGAYIRLLIDPMYWLSISGVPKTFEGYRVIVERRELSVAFH
jgi:hypothetical protein